MGTWAIPVEAASDEIYYNKKLFKQLGITVPANFAFTQDEFKDVVAKCAKAGYAAFATGAADREWAALYIPNALLLEQARRTMTQKLVRGELSWKDPRVVEVFRYYRELIDLGAYAKTLTSMTLAEAHRYFHTEQKACMFPVGSWYTGRAFVPPDKGGQPKDFELGLLNYPADEGRQGARPEVPGRRRLAGGRARRARICRWPSRSRTRSPTSRSATCGWPRPASRPGSRPTRRKIDSPIKWYFDEFGKVNKTTKWVRPHGPECQGCS